jgi:hypothetical protein
MVVEKLGVPSLAQLREQYGSIIALGLDLNFALWSFCAFASSASNLNATHPSPIPMSKETFTLYNYCTTLSPVNQTPVGCGGTPGRVAAGVVTFLQLWLDFSAIMVGLTLCVHRLSLSSYGWRSWLPVSSHTKIAPADPTRATPS